MADGRMAPELNRLLHQLRRREARRRGGAELTYREMATKTGWSLGIVAQYFSGKSLPPIERFDALVRLLGASPAELGPLATARDQADEQRRRRRRPVAEESFFRLLGPVEVVGPRGTARLVGVRQRALVSLLSLNAGRVVTQDRLVDALWGEQPPRTAVRTLYSYVARVRLALDHCGLGGMLRTSGAGYLLAVGPEKVDAGRFERRVALARGALAGGAVEEAVAHLREGLSLWRGDAMADAPAHGWGAAEVDRLNEVRRCAQEDLWEAQLRRGEHAGLVGEIDKLLVSHPGRERSVELLMLALYRSGRAGESVEAYQRLRNHLVDQLGVEPSGSVQRLYTAILRHDTDLDVPRPGGAPATLRPAQLPPRAGHFTGRSAELSVLDSLPRAQPRIGVVYGPGGVGKTALALQWAHRVTDRYPDGQLFLDMRGHDPATALQVTEALTNLLTGLGLPAAQIPTDLAALVGMYRSALHQRRVLLLLDNAASVDQIAALVPPSPTCQLLVTSRHRLTGLAVDHAVSTVELDVLLPDEALTLLRRVIGADRVTGEQAAARQLIDQCDRMPLALRIAAAKLTVRPGGRIAELVADLSGGDLNALSVPGDSRSVRKVFAGAYHALSPLAATMFRRLGQHPGLTFSTGLAATLIDLTADLAQSILDELTGAHLVVDLGMDRYRFHDLIRAYARECAGPDEASRSAARIIDWYLTVADIANRVFDPARDRAGQISVTPPIEAPIPADHDIALAFLDAERANLLPVVRHAAGRGDHRAAWHLTYLLTSFNDLRGHWSAQVELGLAGIAAAQRLADPGAEALSRSGLGFAYNATQRYDEALEQLQKALVLMQPAGDRRAQGMTLTNIAVTYVRLGLLDDAMATFKEALAVHTAARQQPAIALALNNIGHMHTLMGRPDLAMGFLNQGLALTRRIGHCRYEASTLQSLGEARLAEADTGGALEQFEAALLIRQRIGERRLEADTLNLIGLTHGRRGDHAAAATYFRRALALSRELGDRHLEAATLAHLDSSGIGESDDRPVVDDGTF